MSFVTLSCYSLSIQLSCCPLYSFGPNILSHLIFVWGLWWLQHPKWTQIRILAWAMFSWLLIIIIGTGWINECCCQPMNYSIMDLLSQVNTGSLVRAASIISDRPCLCMQHRWCIRLNHGKFVLFIWWSLLLCWCHQSLPIRHGSLARFNLDVNLGKGNQIWLSFFIRFGISMSYCTDPLKKCGESWFVF